MRQTHVIFNEKMQPNRKSEKFPAIPNTNYVTTNCTLYNRRNDTNEYEVPFVLIRCAVMVPLQPAIIATKHLERMSSVSLMAYKVTAAND